MDDVYFLIAKLLSYDNYIVIECYLLLNKNWWENCWESGSKKFLISKQNRMEFSLRGKFYFLHKRSITPGNELPLRFHNTRTISLRFHPVYLFVFDSRIVTKSDWLGRFVIRMTRWKAFKLVLHIFYLVFFIRENKEPRCHSVATQTASISFTIVDDSTHPTSYFFQMEKRNGSQKLMWFYCIQSN